MASMTPNPFQPGAEGVFFDLPDRTYREAPGISNSMLKKLSTHGSEPGSPAHFQVYLKDPTRLTKPLLIGRLAHSAILRPEDSLETITIQPEQRPAVATDSDVKSKKVAVGQMVDWHNGSTYCKEWHKAESAAGNTVLTATEYAGLVGMVKSIAAHPTAARALAQGHAEVSCFKRYWRNVGDKQRMVLRKARMDWVSAGNAIVDIKTTKDARPDQFADQMYRLGYFRQAGYYLQLWNDLHPENPKENFVFIAVEKKPPYAVAMYEVHANAIAAGWDACARDLNIFMACEESDWWPAYDEGMRGLDLPPWTYKKDAGQFVQPAEAL